MTYEHKGKQYVAVLWDVGGLADIGLAAGLTNAADGRGAVADTPCSRNRSRSADNWQQTRS